MNEILEKTLELVYSSVRAMPAHYTSNGDRKQSFCIDFEPLTASDDYEMASESLYSRDTYLSDSIDQGSRRDAVLICGENIMVGAFILTKLGGESLLEDLKKEIIETTLETFGEDIENFKETFSEGKVLNYLNHCADFGYQRANEKNEEVELTFLPTYKPKE
jgi:hypothetical protein